MTQLICRIRLNYGICSILRHGLMVKDTKVLVVVGGHGADVPRATEAVTFWIRYLHYVDQYAINPGPAIGLVALGPWPKSLAPAGDFRGPMLGSENPLTSFPRTFGFGGEWAKSAAFRGAISPTIGVATVGAGFWNIGIYIGGLGAAAGWY